MTIIRQRLSELRRRAFAGRTGEVELFRSMLGAGGVLFLHGPGGIGKSALLDVLADVAVAAGADPITIDGRHVPPVPSSLEAHSIGGRAVLLLDTYELLAPIDDWVREEFLPALPADAVVVIAARRPPSSPWLADPAWRELIRVVAPRDGRLLPAAAVQAEPLRHVRHERVGVGPGRRNVHFADCTSPPTLETVTGRIVGGHGIQEADLQR